MSRAIFVTATDTGAGKTWVTQQLVRRLLAQNIDAQALKPLASGMLPSGVNEDVAALLEVQGKKSVGQINFHTYATPAAPALAAMKEGFELDSAELLAWVADKVAQAEVTLIEGIGGLMVPLISNAQQSWLLTDWLQATAKAEVLLVSSLKLGCMNHLLLSCMALEKLQCQPKWIVLNDIEGSDTGEETKELLMPGLSRIFKTVPDVICVRHAEDFLSML